MRKVNGKRMNAPEYQATTMLLQLGFSGCKTLIQQRTSAARVFAHHSDLRNTAPVLDPTEEHRKQAARNPHKRGPKPKIKPSV